MTRRRFALLVLGLIHASIGLRLLGGVGAGNPDLAIFHELLPVWLRVTLWTGLGLVAICSALFGREISGWTWIVIMPAERTISYLWSGFMWVVPGWPPGAWESFLMAFYWGLWTSLLFALGGWQQAPEVVPPRQESP